MNRKVSTTMAIAAATVAGAIALPAAAQPAGSQYRRSDSSAETTPNADLIASGLFTLAIPYMASVVVATESTRREDYYLYTPVAGPWLNLSHRDTCPPVGGCGNETAYQILLVADGLLQGFGALEILSGFLFPVTTTPSSSTTAPRVRVVPNVARTSASLTAVGTF